MRKLTLKWRAPHQEKYAERALEVYGDPTNAKKLRLVVVKSDGSYPKGIMVPKGHHLAGATILWLPEGAEFEVWEE